MNVAQWLESTNPGQKGISRIEKAKLVELRTRVCDEAEVSIKTLINGKCRGSVVSRKITERLIKATRKDKFKITEDSIVPHEYKHGFRGIALLSSGKFASKIIDTEGSPIHLGIFDDAKGAALAFDKKAIELFGKNALTNKKLGLLD